MDEGVPRGVGEERWTCNPRVSGSIPVARLQSVLLLDLTKALIMGVIVGGDEIMICCFALVNSHCQLNRLA